MGNWKRVVWIIVLAAFLWSPVAPAGREQAAFAQGTRTKIAWVAVSGVMAPIWIAKEKNLYQKYGMDTEVVFVRGSQNATKALLAGDLDITVNSGNAVVNAGAAGQDVVIIASLTNTPGLSLMSKTPMTAADLKGKVIATDKPGSEPHNSLLLALQYLKLTPADVKINPIGPPETVVSAMETGVVDVGMLSPPMLFKGEDLGYHTVVDISTLGIPTQGACVTVTRRYIQAHRDNVEKFMKAFVNAIHILKTDAETSHKVLAKYSKIQDPKILEKTRHYFGVKMIARVPYPTLEGLRTVVKIQVPLNPRIASVDVNRLVDDSFLRELEGSGFIANLYR
ncbi:MAG: ABC transporter substrate-binding protein [Candidatus Tectomicrobia bacterium]|uniref:ABC transporter substrate-binding protein n=1 Tax=Tectimicrobiota bacterium TaxID=2528274 RepID=A0A932GRX6_UNCTE|nr:ABC transporter substrate-binding protein [Candidatus Tectomicrobia bacterium]